MIELLLDRCEGGTDIREILHPARIAIYLTGNMYFDAK